MRHRVAGRHLGRDTAHRRSLYRNLVTDFLRYERITTTEAKAKEVRPLAEKMITLAKRGDLHSRRLALRFVYDPIVVRRMFDEIAPRMTSRPGGYTRITSLEPRKGDGARMAILEMVDLSDAVMPRPDRATAAPTAALEAPAPAAEDESASATEASEEVEVADEVDTEVEAAAEAEVIAAEEQPEAEAETESDAAEATMEESPDDSSEEGSAPEEGSKE